MNDLFKFAEHLNMKYAQSAPLNDIEKAQLFSLVDKVQKVVAKLAMAFGEQSQFGENLLQRLRSDSPAVSAHEAQQIAKLVLTALANVNAVQNSAQALLNK